MLDPDIRQALYPLLKPEPGTGRLLSEVGLWGNTVRIDVARLTHASLDGFEIKSERDTLTRLAAQAEIYGLVFDTLTLVAARQHVSKATAILPSWWGISEAIPSSDGVSITVIREATPNPSTSGKRIAGLLWRGETVALLSAIGATKGLSKMRAGEAHAALARTLPLKLLKEKVFATMLARKDWVDRRDPSFIGPMKTFLRTA